MDLAMKKTENQIAVCQKKRTVEKTTGLLSCLASSLGSFFKASLNILGLSYNGNLILIFNRSFHKLTILI